MVYSQLQNSVKIALPLYLVASALRIYSWNLKDTHFSLLFTVYTVEKCFENIFYCLFYVNEIPNKIKYQWIIALSLIKLRLISCN